MNANDRLLMRRLQGQLSTAENRQLDDALRRDPQLAARLQHLDATWQRLDGPPERPLDADLTRHLMAAAKTHQGDAISWRQAPGWARGGATAALVLGLVLGSLAGSQADAQADETATLEEAAVADLFASPSESMADAFWASLETEIDRDPEEDREPPRHTPLGDPQ